MRYFWLLLTIAAVVWYTFVTTYVSYKGVSDIKEMLRSLSRRGTSEDDTPPDA